VSTPTSRGNVLEVDQSRRTQIRRNPSSVCSCYITKGCEFSLFCSSCRKHSASVCQKCRNGVNESRKKLQQQPDHRDRLIIAQKPDLTRSDPHSIPPTVSTGARLGRIHHDGVFSPALLLFLPSPAAVVLLSRFHRASSCTRRLQGATRSHHWFGTLWPGRGLPPAGVGH